ncbi:MAG: deoxynucleoside kinase [Planctomycetota bacterium]|jgi:deoxyadenosine/deoxycytidine kinase
MSASLISVVGAPAAGKTTVAECIAAELPAQLIREDYAGNPFLADSYAAAEDARLPAQFYFLFSRLTQLAEARWAKEGIFVSDYGFCQDRLFAKARLSEEDFRIYRRMADPVAELVHGADLIISLDASVETLLKRIAERGRNYERALTREFLAGMRAEYEGISDRVQCPVIDVDTETLDVREAAQREQLISMIREKL